MKKSLPNVTIYTDGACLGNPGPGGYGAILFSNKSSKIIYGNSPNTTNNRMELQAVISALQALKKECAVDLYTDSKYVTEAINQNWLYEWENKSWIRKKGRVPNSDLWKELIPLLSYHEVTFHWIKGHNDNKWNEECDKIATNQALIAKEATGIGWHRETMT